MREICQSGSMSGNRKQHQVKPECGDEAKAESHTHRAATVTAPVLDSTRTSDEAKRRLAMRTRQVIVALSAIIFQLLLTQAAEAKQPLINKSHFNTSFENPGCGDFTAEIDLDVKSTETTFFDAAGNPVRLRVSIRFDGTITNVENSKFLISRNPFIQTFDLLTGESTIVGLNFRVQVPNGPTVAIGAGKIIFDASGNIIFQAGPQAFFDNLPNLPESVCSALR
jgi:hypothetical protein